QPDRRRALELLAASRDGCTEAIMMAHGFTVAQMGELVRAGLASATAERVAAGRTHGRGRAGTDHRNRSASITAVRVITRWYGISGAALAAVASVQMGLEGKSGSAPH